MTARLTQESNFRTYSSLDYLKISVNFSSIKAGYRWSTEVISLYIVFFLFDFYRITFEEGFNNRTFRDFTARRMSEITEAWKDA